jgi:hypothetical protein
VRVNALARSGRTGEAEEPVRSAVAVRRREPDGREEDRRYSWIEDHLARLDGKAARAEYYARLG